MFPPTSRRVERHTTDSANRRIRRQIEDSAQRHAGRPEEIGIRLGALDEEWDVERTLEATAATLALGGTLLGVFADMRFLVVPAVVTAFLLQHALQGWCPPLAILRRLGMRTTAEIDQERYALKALRGDFYDAGANVRAGTALCAVHA